MKRKFDSEDGKDIFPRQKLNKCDVEATDHPERPTSQTTMYDLPPDVLMIIFSWFPVRELCLNISPVCKLWHLFSRDRLLWKHLSFKGDSVNTECLCLLLSHATFLRSLQLIIREDADAVLRQVALTNRSLQILIVKRCLGSSQRFRIHEEVLVELIKSCNKLVEITIQRTEFYSKEFMKLLGTVLPYLKRINFSHNKQLDSRSIIIAACNCTSLEKVCINWSSEYETSLDFSEDDVNDNDINALCTRMRDSLMTLKITGSELTNNAMLSIAQCTFLHTLSIHNAFCILDEGILLLTTLHNLSALVLTFSFGISPDGWEELFIKSKWKSLRKLYLNCSLGIHDNVLESIGGTCPNLEKICLMRCSYFTNIGMTKLLKGCKQLAYLKVVQTQFNVVHSFPLIPDYTPNLKCLVYECTDSSVNKQELENARLILSNLKMKLPNLEIHSEILL